MCAGLQIFDLDAYPVPFLAMLQMVGLAADTVHLAFDLLHEGGFHTLNLRQDGR
jgi:hypothetical protein